MGRLDNNKAVPEDAPDKSKDATSNQQEPRQVNAHDVVNQQGGPTEKP